MATFARAILVAALWAAVAWPTLADSPHRGCETTTQDRTVFAPSALAFPSRSAWVPSAQRPYVPPGVPATIATVSVSACGAGVTLGESRILVRLLGSGVVGNRTAHGQAELTLGIDPIAGLTIQWPDSPSNTAFSVSGVTTVISGEYSGLARMSTILFTCERQLASPSVTVSNSSNGIRIMASGAQFCPATQTKTPSPSSPGTQTRPRSRSHSWSLPSTPTAMPTPTVPPTASLVPTTTKCITCTRSESGDTESRSETVSHESASWSASLSGSGSRSRSTSFSSTPSAFSSTPSVSSSPSLSGSTTPSARSPTATTSVSASASITISPPPTRTATASVTASPSATLSPVTVTQSRSVSVSKSWSASGSATITPPPTPSATPSATGTFSGRSATPSDSSTASVTVSDTATASASASTSVSTSDSESSTTSLSWSSTESASISDTAPTDSATSSPSQTSSLSVSSSESESPSSSRSVSRSGSTSASRSQGTFTVTRSDVTPTPTASRTEEFGPNTGVIRPRMRAFPRDVAQPAVIAAVAPDADGRSDPWSHSCYPLGGCAVLACDGSGTNAVLVFVTSVGPTVSAGDFAAGSVQSVNLTHVLGYVVSCSADASAVVGAWFPNLGTNGGIPHGLLRIGTQLALVQAPVGNASGVELVSARLPAAADVPPKSIHALMGLVNVQVSMMQANGTIHRVSFSDPQARTGTKWFVAFATTDVPQCAGAQHTDHFVADNALDQVGQVVGACLVGDRLYAFGCIAHDWRCNVKSVDARGEATFDLIRAQSRSFLLTTVVVTLGDTLVVLPTTPSEQQLHWALPQAVDLGSRSVSVFQRQGSSITVACVRAGRVAVVDLVTGASLLGSRPDDRLSIDGLDDTTNATLAASGPQLAEGTFVLISDGVIVVVLSFNANMSHVLRADGFTDLPCVVSAVAPRPTRTAQLATCAVLPAASIASVPILGFTLPLDDSEPSVFPRLQTFGEPAAAELTDFPSLAVGYVSPRHVVYVFATCQIAHVNIALNLTVPATALPAGLPPGVDMHPIAVLQSGTSATISAIVRVGATARYVLVHSAQQASASSHRASGTPAAVAFIDCDQIFELTTSSDGFSAAFFCITTRSPTPHMRLVSASGLSRTFTVCPTNWTYVSAAMLIVQDTRIWFISTVVGSKVVGLALGHLGFITDTPHEALPMIRVGKLQSGPSTSTSASGTFIASFNDPYAAGYTRVVTAVVFGAAVSVCNITLPVASVVSTIGRPFEDSDDFVALMVATSAPLADGFPIGFRAEVAGRQLPACRWKSYDIGLPGDAIALLSASAAVDLRNGTGLGPVELLSADSVGTHRMVLRSVRDPTTALLLGPFGRSDMVTATTSPYAVIQGVGPVGGPCRATVASPPNPGRHIVLVDTLCRVAVVDVFSGERVGEAPRRVMPGYEAETAFVQSFTVVVTTQAGTRAFVSVPSGTVRLEIAVGTPAFTTDFGSLLSLAGTVTLLRQQTKVCDQDHVCLVATATPLDSLSTNRALITTGASATAQLLFRMLGGLSLLPTDWDAAGEVHSGTGMCSAGWTGIACTTKPSQTLQVTLNASGVSGFVSFAAVRVVQGADVPISNLSLRLGAAIYGHLDTSVLEGVEALDVAGTSVTGSAAWFNLHASLTHVNVSHTRMACYSACFSADGLLNASGLYSFSARGLLGMGGPLDLGDSDDIYELTHLDLQGSHVGYSLPTIMSKANNGTILPSLRHLDLSYCGMTGPLWPDLGPLITLEHLDLSGNAFNAAADSTAPAWLSPITLQTQSTWSPQQPPVRFIGLSNVFPLAGRVGLNPAPLPLLEVFDVSNTKDIGGAFDARASTEEEPSWATPRNTSLQLHVDLRGTRVTSVVRGCFNTSACSSSTSGTPWAVVTTDEDVPCICDADPDSIVGIGLVPQMMCALGPRNQSLIVYPLVQVAAYNPAAFSNTTADRIGVNVMSVFAISEEPGKSPFHIRCDVPMALWVFSASGMREAIFHDRLFHAMQPCLTQFAGGFAPGSENYPFGPFNVSFTAEPASVDGGPRELAVTFLPSATSAVLNPRGCERGASTVCALAGFTAMYSMRLQNTAGSTVLETHVTQPGVNPKALKAQVPFPTLWLPPGVPGTEAPSETMFPAEAFQNSLNAQLRPGLVATKTTVADGSRLTIQFRVESGAVLDFPFSIGACGDWHHFDMCPAALPPVTHFDEGEIKGDLGSLELHGAALTLLWEACQSTTLSTRAVSNGFVQLSQAFPMSKIFTGGWGQYPPASVNYAQAIQLCAEHDTLSCQVTNNHSIPMCGYATGQLLRQYSSCMFRGKDISNMFSAFYFEGSTHPTNISCIPQPGPLLGLPGERDALANVTAADYFDAASLVQQTPDTLRVRALCYNAGKDIAFVDVNTRLPVFTLASRGCAGARQFTCSSCLPYVEPSNSALPYYLLLLSSLKDVLFMLLGLLVLGRPAVRKRLARVIARMVVLTLPYDRVVMPYDSDSDSDDGRGSPSMSDSSSPHARPARAAFRTGTPSAFNSELATDAGMATPMLMDGSVSDYHASPYAGAGSAAGSSYRPPQLVPAHSPVDDDREPRSHEIVAGLSAGKFSPSHRDRPRDSAEYFAISTEAQSAGERDDESQRRRKAKKHNKSKGKKRDYHTRHFIEFNKWRALWEERFCPRIIREDEVKFNYCELLGLGLGEHHVSTKKVLQRIRAQSPTGTGSAAQSQSAFTRSGVSRRSGHGGPTSMLLSGSMDSPSAWRLLPGAGSISRPRLPPVPSTRSREDAAGAAGVSRQTSDERQDLPRAAVDVDPPPPEPLQERQAPALGGGSTGADAADAALVEPPPNLSGPLGEDLPSAPPVSLPSPPRPATTEEGHHDEVPNASLDRAAAGEPPPNLSGPLSVDPVADSVAALVPPDMGVSPPSSAVPGVSANDEALRRGLGRDDHREAEAPRDFLTSSTFVDEDFDAVDDADFNFEPDERYKFFKEVVLRKSRSLVTNTSDIRVRAAFRELVETVARTGADGMGYSPPTSPVPSAGGGAVPNASVGGSSSGGSPLGGGLPNVASESALAAFRALRKHERKWTKHERAAFQAFDAAAEMECVLLESDAVDRKFTPQIWMLSLELLYALVLLVVCMFQGGRNLHDSFRSYEAKYFTFVNSCTSVGFVVNSALRVMYAGNGRPGFFVFASVALLMPVLVTHIIPGMFVFAWLPALVIPAAAATLVGAQKLKKRGLGFLGIGREHLEKVEGPVFLFVNVVTRVIATFAVTLVLQTLFNYMVLFYHRDELGLSYGQIIAYEYHSRRWDCLWEKWFADATKALQVWSTFV